MVWSGVIIAAITGFFGYMKNRDEIRAKYQQTQVSAASGYDALAASVKELQAATLVQHDYIVKLEGHLEGLEKSLALAMTGQGTGRIRPPVEPPRNPAADLPAPPERPSYGIVPPDFAAAQQQR